MKNFIKTIFSIPMLSAALFASSCSEGGYEEYYMNNMSVEPQSVRFSKTGGSQMVYLTSGENVGEWYVTIEDLRGYSNGNYKSVAADQITVSPQSGNGSRALTITAKANNENIFITGDVRIKSANARTTIYVSQEEGSGGGGGNTGGNDNTGGNTGGGSTQQKPSAPTGVSVSNEGNNYIPDIRVRWNSVSNATNYYIYKSSSANGSYSKIGESSYTSYADQNPPTNGASAYYKVKAVNSAGESEYSAYAQYTSIKNDAAFTPATPSVSVSGTSTISISWSCATGSNYGTPKSYEVYKRNPATSQFERLTTTTSRSYSDRNPHPGINRYGVVAVNDAGASSMGLGYSSEVPLSKPSSFSAAKSGSYVNFTWSKVANATGYQIYYSSSASGSYSILEQIDNASTTSKNVYYPASSGTTMYFKIRAYWQEGYDGIVYSDYTSYQSVKF